MTNFLLILSTLLLSSSVVAMAQYAINWHTIAGGGGTSTNGQYSVSGTLGQHDAGGAMTNGQYAVTGGFWSRIQVVQTEGLPELVIARSGSAIIVSWPSTGNYTLQQNANVANSADWATSGYTVTTASGTNSITVTAPTGYLFFRLKQP